LGFEGKRTRQKAEDRMQKGEVRNEIGEGRRKKKI
jgi:hypothetical protein